MFRQSGWPTPNCPRWVGPRPVQTDPLRTRATRHKSAMRRDCLHNVPRDAWVERAHRPACSVFGKSSYFKQRRRQHKTADTHVAGCVPKPALNTNKSSNQRMTPQRCRIPTGSGRCTPKAACSVGHSLDLHVLEWRSFGNCSAIDPPR